MKLTSRSKTSAALLHNPNQHQPIQNQRHHADLELLLLYHPPQESCEDAKHCQHLGW